MLLTPRSFTTRFIAGTVFAGAMLSLASASFAQADYPRAPIKIIVPAVPGGSGDAIARIIAEEVGPALGQPIVVENKAGAGMVIGLNAVEQAAPDGYTLGIGPRGPIVIGPTVPGGLPFDPRERLATVAKIAGVPIVFVANEASGIKSVDGLIQAAKSSKGGLSFGSPGQYTSHRIAVELLGVKTDAHFSHVPYKGGGQAIIDLLGGQIPFAALDLTAVEQHVASGKLNALAVTSAQRVSLAPNIPTLIEQKQAVEVDSWLGVFAPKNTPKPIVDKLSAALEAAFRKPEAQAKLRKVGLEPDFESSARFARTVDTDIRGWNALREKVLPELQK